MMGNYRPYDIGLFADFKHPIKTAITPVYFPNLPIDKAVEELVRMSVNRNVILAVTDSSRKLLETELYEHNYSPDVISFMPELFEEGFQNGNTVVLTGRELFGANIRKGRFSRKFNEAQQLDDYQDLNEDDYVVHNQYGIGRYKGIVTREVRGNHNGSMSNRLN